MSRDLSINNAHPRLRFDSKAVARVVALLDEHFHFVPADKPHLAPAARKRLQAPPPAVPQGELSLAFLTDAKLAALHADFLDDPTTTDVITFEGQPDLGFAGEICVSADTALAYAKEHDRDFSQELTLYVVHGWLHLAGYDDLRPAKKRRMRAAEARALKLLRAHGAIPEFTLRQSRRA